MPSVFVTEKVNKLIDQQKAKLGLQHKEGIVHSLLVLALTDEAFMKRAAETSRYFGDLGQVNLENMGL